MIVPVAALLVALLVLTPGWGTALLAAVIVWEVAEKLFWVRLIGRYPVATGREAIIGSTVTVTRACLPDGRVQLRGESWPARCHAGARSGETLVVGDIDRITLIITKET